MGFEQQEQELRALAHRLLCEGAADTVIGFCAHADGRGVPGFLTDPAETEKLVWNGRCVPNLAKYLLGRKGKTALAAKPCDARAVVNLLVEKQLDRGGVYLIGLDCPGMTDADGRMLPACRECNVHTPPAYDVRIRNDEAAALSALPAKEEARTSERFGAEIDKCILCCSCRQACPGCYCETCFMDRGSPDFLTGMPDRQAKMLYHLGRAMHLAGRCVECGACENVCASGVEVRYLIRHVTGFIGEEYGFSAGMSDETPALATYRADDAQTGFLGGAHG